MNCYCYTLIKLTDEPVQNVLEMFKTKTALTTLLTRLKDLFVAAKIKMLIVLFRNSATGSIL